MKGCLRLFGLTCLGLCVLFTVWIFAVLGFAIWNAPRDQHAFCRKPDAVDMAELAGTWTARYEDSLIQQVEMYEPEAVMNGVETLTLAADGTYTHTFAFGTYQYQSEPAAWQMHYFAGGVVRVGRSKTLGLMPEKPDQLDYQDANKPSEGVLYPDDGYLYLYLRVCSGKLVMQQMMFGPWDPDSMMIVNPMFRRE